MTLRINKKTLASLNDKQIGGVSGGLVTRKTTPCHPTTDKKK